MSKRKTASRPRSKKALAAFVAGAGKPRGLVGRADGSAMRRLTVYVEPELYKRVKAWLGLI